MPSLNYSSVQDVAESGVSTSLARRGSCRSSCSTCSKIISVLSAPYGEKSKIALGKFSDVLATECFHSESLQCLEFDSLTRFKKLRKFYPPHSCQDPDFLIEKLSNTDYAVFRKNCDACSSLFFSPLFNHKSKPTRLAAREHEHSKAGRARLMDSQWIDVNVVQNWLTCCEQEHGSKCAEYKIRGLGTVRPEWLIDTIRGCISPSGGQPRRYVALSYTWGQVKMFLALKSNIEELQRPGVLLSGPIADQIPKTIRDAIGIARCLRVPFLWTDCLCIVQDDKKALYNNLRQMHLIYSNSVLTIIVENGRDANHGIRGIYEVSDPRSIQETRMKIAGGEMLVSVETDYVGNPYSEYDYHERMWTFQEYYFSKRRLVFGSGPVVWECNKASWSEHLYPYPTEELGGEENAISSSIRSQIPALDDLGHITLKFNTKVLSHHQDVLFAFSGIQTLLSQRKFPGGLLYGLPEFNFDNALVWHFYVSANRTRRRPSAQFRGDPTQDQLPSWSWMGWQGSFDFLSDSEFECEPHGFTQLGFRAPVTKWHTMDSPRSENRRAIESRWYNFRSPGSNKNVLLDGWSQSYSKTPSGDESASKISYSPVSEPGRSFWYPVPLLLEPIETKETKTQTQYLYCETSRAFLCQSPMRAHKSIHWDRVIKDREGKRIGGFQLCWKAENMLDSSHGSQPEQIELVAIVKGWVLLYAKMDTPGISDSETLPTTFSFWDPNDKEGPDPGSNEGEDTSSDEGEDTSSDEGEDPSLEGEDPSDWTQRKFDCYFVLAIKWKDDIAYREGVGFVFEAAWERFKEAKPLCLVLG
ncbi:HET-domain-containing protein [Xylaria scruposa]|nr:HET-domain-containing protein [Xylaria scruposa]